MAVTRNDIDIRKIKDPWTQKAIEYALISWTSHFNRMQSPSPYYRMEKIVIGKIAERAFHDYIKESNLQYDMKGSTKWYAIDSYDVAVADKPIDIKASFLDRNHKYFQNLLPLPGGKTAEWILGCTALVGADQLNSSSKKFNTAEKIYVFSYVDGAFSGNKNRAVVHAFWDYLWLKIGTEAKATAQVGMIQINFNGSLHKYKIKIYGTTSKNVAHVESIELNKNQLTSKTSFYQIFSVEFLGGYPDGELTFTSSNIKLIEKILPDSTVIIKRPDKTSPYICEANNWHELWFDSGAYCYTSGYIVEEDFRLIANFYKRFEKNILQYAETKQDNFGCLTNELNPLKELGNF
jgi:hypothetical protein